MCVTYIWKIIFLGLKEEQKTAKVKTRLCVYVKYADKSMIQMEIDYPRNVTSRANENE
jgi:hypothetical protein